jgi:flagellin FlaB
MGIGAMIVFIAMVLVAGIAASVLVQTANKLEIQAMTTGDQTINQVATGLKVSSITGHKTGTALDLGYITVEPRAGAGDVDLSKSYIEISNSVQKCVLTYGGEYSSRSQIGGDMFSPGGTAFTALGAKDFGVMVLEDADGSVTDTTPAVNLGDKVALTFDATACFGAGLDVRIDVWGLVQPEEGSAGAFAFTTPASFAGGTVFSLY